MKYIKKYIHNLKYKIAPCFQNLSKLFLVSFIYSLLIYIITFYLVHEELPTRIMISFIPVFTFYIVWGIGAVIMMGQYVDRDLPLLKSDLFLKPGRYIMTEIGPFAFYKELRTSPVDDFCIVLSCFDLIVIPIEVVSLFINHDVYVLTFMSIVVAVHFAVLRELNRLERDYVDNMKKAKIIFFEHHGDLNILKQHEDYYRYQASKEYEEMWMLELKENHSHDES